MSRKTDEKKEEKVLTPAEQASAFMHTKENAAERLNFLPTTRYKISTGSLKMDIALGGGITPGITRLVGQTTGGKTSAALEFLRQFFLVRKDGYGVFFMAEGRLSEEVKERSGVTFVTDPKEWKPGTCLIWEGHIYESVVSFMMNLVLNNPTNAKFFFIIDSLDGLILRGDLEKTPEEAYKVAGPAVIGKKMAQRLMLRMWKNGHFMVVTSQVTAAPKIDQKQKTEFRLVSGTSGNWAVHYPDNIWEFQPRFKDQRILKNPSNDKYDPIKNPIIGHEVVIIIKKSSNEKYESRVSYPICYGRTNGTSVWVEREIGDALLMYGFMDKKGSWLSFKEDLYEEFKKLDNTMPSQVQGIEQLYKSLTDHPAIKEYCFKMFRDTLTPEQVSIGEGDPFEDEEEEGEQKEVKEAK